MEFLRSLLQHTQNGSSDTVLPEASSRRRETICLLPKLIDCQHLSAQHLSIRLGTAVSRRDRLGTGQIQPDLAIVWISEVRSLGVQLCLQFPNGSEGASHMRRKNLECSASPTAMPCFKRDSPKLFCAGRCGPPLHLQMGKGKDLKGGVTCIAP